MNLASLHDEHVLITGGTGFYGLSILDARLASGAVHPRLTMMSRNPASFLAKHPEFASLKGVEFLAGDVRSVRLPQDVTMVMHLATTAADRANPDSIKEMTSTILDGTEHILNECRRVGVKRLLFASSGAVYGAGQTDHCTEDSIQPLGAVPRTEYGEAKFKAETLCHSSGVPTVIARGFAFFGKYFPLDGPYAISSFLKSAKVGLPIDVRSPETVRSYLDARDLVDGLWALLFRGRPGEAYNLGSDQAITMRELAGQIAAHYGVSVQFGTSTADTPADIYVPSIVKVQGHTGWSPLQRYPLLFGDSAQLPAPEAAARHR